MRARNLTPDSQPPPSFQTANIPVQIKGVGMFDFLHGSDRRCANGIELHPVLDIILQSGQSDS